MDDYSLLIDLHLEGQRQGPGSDAVTELAVQLAGLDRSRPLAIADIGSGIGLRHCCWPDCWTPESPRSICCRSFSMS